jgi:N-acyl-D-aspartate/D-glutamate deacylase
MTSLAADRFGLTGRGRLTPGAYADAVVFDPATIRDVATFADSKREPEGVHWVIVNGAIAVDHGRHIGARTGRLLRYGVA